MIGLLPFVGLALLGCSPILFVAWIWGRDIEESRRWRDEMGRRGR